MKVQGELLKYFHLNKSHLLTAKNLKILLEYFKILDIHQTLSLNGNLIIISKKIS